MIRHAVAVCWILTFACLAPIKAANEGEPTFSDETKAGIDYQIQGEYEGVLTRDRKWGAHVIALGNGKFKTIGYRGGLPGAGWMHEPGEYHEGSLDNGVMITKGPNFSLQTDGQALRVFGRDGQPLGDLQKIQRKSPTLGKEPPTGALVLFDGKSVDHWENAKLVDQRYLGATGCYSKEKFGDHALHIEFRTPFMPASTGQGRGNSGVYVQGRYEVQVLDSFGLSGENNECGGIYEIAKPKVNMCFPPLSWQTYDIEFTAAKFDPDGVKTANARITVRHNGIVIHENLELPRGTPGHLPEGPHPEGLFLQDHSNPVVYRNVWVVKK